MISLSYSTQNIKIKTKENLYLRFLLLIASAMWAYWAFWALITPVTVWDSNAYNIARIDLELQGGLFNNPYINDSRQIFMTWVFDATSLPFHLIGKFEALPSFLCLSGIILVTYRLTKRYFGQRAGVYTTLSILSMPCLMYQATSTKPDIAVVFFLSCWLLAIFEYKRNKKNIYLFIMALALSLAAGAKATGVLFFPLLTTISVALLIKDIKSTVFFSYSLLINMLLFAGIENYINNFIIFHHIFGPVNQRAANPDFIKGALANLIRVIYCNTTTGYESFVNRDTMLTHVWEAFSRNTVKILHLTNLGFQKDINIYLDDTNMRFLKNSTESESDYGPIASLGLWFSLIYVFLRINIKNPKWWLALSGFIYLFCINAVIGMGLWGNRYMIGGIVLTTTLLSISIGQTKIKILHLLFLITCIFSMTFTALASFNRKPSDVTEAISHPDIFQLRENPRIIPIYEDIKQLVNTKQIESITLFAGEDAWILPFYHINKLKVYSTPNPTNMKLKNKDVILALQCDFPDNIKKHLKIIRIYKGGGSFWGRDSTLYQYIDN